MEPKPESLWWANTYNGEDERTLKLGRRGTVRLCRSLRRSIFCDIAFAGLGKGCTGRKRRSEKEWTAGGSMGSSTARRACLLAGHVSKWLVMSLQYCFA